MNTIHDVVTTPDHVRLPALLYPQLKKTKNRKLALYLHGTGGGSVFYGKDKNEVWANALHSHGIDFAVFNNRGANVIHRNKWFDESGEKQIAWAGCAYELMKDCKIDINTMVKWAHGWGYAQLYLIGHSTGANKIVLYDHLTKGNNDISQYALLGGGDDTGLWYNELGQEQFYGLLNDAKAAVGAGGRGLELIDPSRLGNTVMSWQSLLDMYDPQGDYNLFPFHEALSGERLSKRRLFAEFESITKPTLVMYGLQDEYCYGRVRDCVDVLKAHAGQKLRVAYEIIDGADHSFTDQLPVVAAAVAAFFAES